MPKLRRDAKLRKDIKGQEGLSRLRRGTETTHIVEAMEERPRPARRGQGLFTQPRELENSDLP